MDQINPVTPVIALTLVVALIKTATDFPAYVTARQWSAVWKQAIAWAVGVGAAFALRASDFGVSIQATPTVSLASATPATVAIFGLALASGASVLHMGIQAIDGSQSAYVPPVTPGSQPSTMGSNIPSAPVAAVTSGEMSGPVTFAVTATGTAETAAQVGAQTAAALSNAALGVNVPVPQ